MLDIAIVAGVRTPFVKAFGPMESIPAHELGRIAAAAVLERADVQVADIDQVVFGSGTIHPEAPNPARVIALLAGIPEDRPAHTVQRNCASGLEAVSTAAQILQLGEAGTVLAGGTESMSQIPILFSSESTALFLRLMQAKGWWQRIKGMLRFRPRHFKPVPGIKLGLTDPICGLMMGETAEVLADDFGITRQQQDEYALQSHQRAAAAVESCVLSEEITPVKTGGANGEVKKDIGPRKNQTLEALAKLPPYFRPKNGTVTVGNSCSITDGAAALVMMPGEAARAQGRKPLGYLRGYAYAGCEPRRMGLGPVYATSKLLAKTGLSLKDIDLIEMNEAFAAQIIANEKAFASDQFAQKHLGLSKALGEIDRSRFNVNGGAIALGHPVGATGTRLALTALKELERRNLRYGLATLCIGGGQGGALLLERGS
jgi:acetyl-CoA C-acetyltransferase/acetyl-CoA acyltransferase